MRKLLLVAALVLAAFGGPGIASAHECTYDGDQRDTGNQVECHESPVTPSWRDGNYVPLFDLENRDDPAQRKEAQRWRECEGYREDGTYYSDQMCAWAAGGYSHTPGNGGEMAPNELHAGFAASHCFLGEFQHQCQDHDTRHGEGVHDKHGGTIYADVCAAENAENRRCDDGVADTQAGIVIMDHNACGVIVPIVACIDEYHVVRPADQAYTMEQMEDSQEYIPRILADPELYLCGKPQYRSGNPVCPEPEGGSGGASVGSPAEVVTALMRAHMRIVDRLANADADAAPLATRSLAARSGETSRGSVPFGFGLLLLAPLAVRALRRSRA